MSSKTLITRLIISTSSILRRIAAGDDDAHVGGRARAGDREAEALERGRERRTRVAEEVVPRLRVVDRHPVELRDVGGELVSEVPVVAAGLDFQREGRRVQDLIDD